MDRAGYGTSCRKRFPVSALGADPWSVVSRVKQLSAARTRRDVDEWGEVQALKRITMIRSGQGALRGCHEGCP